MQRVQLFKVAVVFIGLAFVSPSNQKLFSLFIELFESDPWQAFFVPSVPNNALRELGASAKAFYVLVGPIKPLHFSTALSATSSIPTTTSLVIKP